MVDKKEHEGYEGEEEEHVLVGTVWDMGVLEEEEEHVMEGAVWSIETGEKLVEVDHHENKYQEGRQDEVLSDSGAGASRWPENGWKGIPTRREKVVGKRDEGIIPGNGPGKRIVEDVEDGEESIWKESGRTSVPDAGSPACGESRMGGFRGQGGHRGWGGRIL